MTSLAEARSEFVAAIATAGVEAKTSPGGDPPYVYVRADGVPDVSHVVRGTVLGTWAAVCVGGGWTDEGAALELDTLKMAVLTALRSLDGWKLGDIGRDGIRSHQGAELLTADVTANRYVDL